MKRIVVFASALALFGSMVFAMEEDVMDGEMMMEAPAPSVKVGGSGKIGIRNVDDGNEATEDFSLVRAYKVTFDSTGTTDGGLMFGAGISIRDDTTETDGPNKNQAPAVKGSYVFVGGADGSWKLQFGGNDPGIDLAGGFGVADDHFGGEGDATMALSGAFGDTRFRLTAADPEAMGDSDDDWSMGVSHSINTISVGVGMDSESGLAIGIGTDISGVTTSLFWSKSGHVMEPMKPELYQDPDNAPAPRIEIVNLNQDNTGIGAKASMDAGENAIFSVAYSTSKGKYTGSTLYTADTASLSLGNGGSVTRQVEAREIEISFDYVLGGGATLETSIVKNDVETSGLFQGNRGYQFTSSTSADDNIYSLADSKSTTTISAGLKFTF